MRYTSSIQAAKAVIAVVPKSPLLSMVPTVGDVDIGGHVDPV